MKLLKLFYHGMEGFLIGGLSSLVTALIAHGLISLVCFYALLMGAGAGFVLGIIMYFILHNHGR